MPPARNHPERDLHKALVKFLILQCRREVIWFHPPAGELRTVKTAALLKAMGTKPGIADLLFFPPNAPDAALELKAKDGSLSPAQREFRDSWIAGGRRHAVAKTFDEAVETLGCWGFLRT